MRIKIKDIKHPRAGEPSLVGHEVTVKGWIRTVRNQKTFTFVEINDGSTLSNFQIIASTDVPGYETLLPQLTTGASIAATGVIVESPAAGQALEMQASSMTVIGKCDAEAYLLQKKRHSFEFLRTIAHLRPRTNTLGAVTPRAQCTGLCHPSFFQDRGFLYIHTPIITSSDCEGSGQDVPSHDARSRQTS